MNFLEKKIFKEEILINQSFSLKNFDQKILWGIIPWINKFKEDKSGFLSLVDSLFAILLLLIAIFSFNLVVDMEIPSLTEESYDSKISQDTFELMAMNINGNDYSTLDSIVYILKTNNNSKPSIKTVASVSEDFFNSHILNKHYYFIETNQLNSKVLSKNGDLSLASNVSVAIRNYGDYSFKLYVW